MKFAIGCTRAGLALKKEVIKYLDSCGHSVDDLGMKEDGEFVSYNNAAAAVADAVSEGKYPKAVIICGTGAGSAIVANKFRGVYAVHCTNTYEAEKASAVNNANVMVLGEWLTPANHAVEIIKTWLGTEFGAGFEKDWREFLLKCVDEIKSLEESNFR